MGKRAAFPRWKRGPYRMKRLLRALVRQRPGGGEDRRHGHGGGDAGALAYGGPAPGALGGRGRPEKRVGATLGRELFSWPGADDFTEAFLEMESKARTMLNIPEDRFIIVIPHHVAFL